MGSPSMEDLTIAVTISGTVSDISFTTTQESKEKNMGNEPAFEVGQKVKYVGGVGVHFGKKGSVVKNTTHYVDVLFDDGNSFSAYSYNLEVIKEEPEVVFDPNGVGKFNALVRHGLFQVYVGHASNAEDLRNTGRAYLKAAELVPGLKKSYDQSVEESALIVERDNVSREVFGFGYNHVHSSSTSRIAVDTIVGLRKQIAETEK